MRGFRFFFSVLRRSCLRPKAQDVSACGRQSSSSLEKKTSGTQVSISDQKYRKVSQRGHVRVSLRAHAGHMLSVFL